MPFIEKLLHESSSIAKRNFGKVTGTVKKEDMNQVLTQADITIGKKIVGSIQENYHTHNIIDEETGIINRQSRFTWVIDPIDGTSNFVAGLPFYGIMIGLLEGETPIAGGIMLPFFNQIYLAQKNSGAYCNSVKIKSLESSNLSTSLVAYNIDGHQEAPEKTRQEAILIGELILGIRNLRTSNSCFDAAMVACGKYGGYINQTCKIWDIVAVQLLLEEASCTCTDIAGKNIIYANPLEKAGENFTVCAAAYHLYEPLQKIIHTVLNKQNI